MACILIVDDDLGIRALLNEILLDEGYEILQAGNGAEAVEIARAEQPDLILMDLMMPVLDGAEATAILKRDPRTRRIRIIVMSAGRNVHRQMDDVLADRFLAKPFDLDRLLADVALHLRTVLDTEPVQMARGSSAHSSRFVLRSEPAC